MSSFLVRLYKTTAFQFFLGTLLGYLTVPLVYIVLVYCLTSHSESKRQPTYLTITTISSGKSELYQRVPKLVL